MFSSSLFNAKNFFPRCFFAFVLAQIVLIVQISGKIKNKTIYNLQLIFETFNFQIIPISFYELPFYAYIHKAEEIIKREQQGIFWDSNWDETMKHHPEGKSAIYNILVNSKPYFLYKISVSTVLIQQPFLISLLTHTSNFRLKIPFLHVLWFGLMQAMVMVIDLYFQKIMNGSQNFCPIKFHSFK